MGTSTGVRDLHVDQNLTNIAINYRPVGTIVDLIAPIITVQKARDQFPVYNRGEILAIESAERSPGTEAKKVSRSVSSRAYEVKNYALAYDITVEDRANVDAAYEAEMFGSAAEYLVWKLTAGWHKRVLDTVGSASNVSTGFVPASAWTTTGGDPFSQIVQIIEQIKATTGQRPNSVVAGWKAWSLMRRNTNLRNMLNGTNNGGGLVTREQVGNLLELDRFLVAETFLNTANEAQAESLSAPFDDKVLVYWAPTAPSRDAPSFMYTFRQEVPGVPSLVAERHPFDTRRKVETVEVGYYQTEEVVGSAYGALLLGVGSSQANGLA
jgi:hypothetical protein